MPRNPLLPNYAVLPQSDHSQGGPFVGNLFKPDSPVMRFMSNLADLIILNLLFLACCIPIATIGPACTALCYVARGIAAGDAPAVRQTFFRAFRENFKQALFVFLILLIPVGLAVTYLLMAASGGLDTIPALKYMCILAVVIIALVCSYVYPLLAHYDNTLGNTLKNAFLLPLVNPFLALVVTALNLLPVLLLLINPGLFARCAIFWLLVGCALAALINAKMLGRFFARLTPEEQPPEEETNTES